MIMIKNESTFSMEKGTDIEIQLSSPAKLAAVIILHFNKLVHHIGGILPLAFCSEIGAAIESAVKAPQITASERHTTEDF